MSRSVLTIGNFDGVHLGHRAILARARAVADDHHARLIVLTFDPHPAAVLRPGSQPPLLCSSARRVELLMDAGADQVNLLKPTARVLGQSPEAFVGRLVEEFAPVAIIEGPDFHFGKGRAGNLETLAALGATHGFDVEAVPGVEVALHDRLTTPVSSSLVRWLVGRGRVADAQRCLGRPYALHTTITRGEQRGRTIGVPTINLDLAHLEGHIFPADGVYAGVATLPSGIGDLGCGMLETHDAAPGSSDIPDPTSHIPHPPTFPAAISVGIKPTFGKRGLTIEAHLIGYTSDDPDALYGQFVGLDFARWLRDQYAFAGIDALRAQLTRDIDRSRSLLADASTAPAHTPTPA